MGESEMKMALATYLVSKGLVLEADQQSEIAKMAASLPPATAQEKGLTTDLQKAYEVYLIETKGSSAPVTASTATVTAPTATLSPADKEAMNKQLRVESKDRKFMSQAASVEKLVVDKPAPSTYIPAGSKMTIDSQTAFQAVDTILAKPGYSFATEQDKANYDTLKAAQANHTPVDVYIGKPVYRAIGYVINVPSGQGTTSEPKMMTREQTQQFLTLNTAGYIQSNGAKMGLYLRMVKAHRNGKGQDVPARAILGEANKDQAKANPAISRTVSKETHSAKVKSALEINIKTPTMKQDGSGPIIRKYRISGTCTLPVLNRGAEYIDVFGTGERQSNKLLDHAPEGKQLENINLAIRQDLSDLMLRASEAMDDSYADLENRLSAFKANSAGTAAPAVNM